MTVQEEIAATLSELQTIYDEVLILWNQWKELQSLPAAQAAYDAELGEQTRRAEGLDKLYRSLKLDRDHLQSVEPQENHHDGGSDSGGDLRADRADEPLHIDPEGLVVEEEPGPLLPEDERDARRRLEVILRFASSLGVGKQETSEINRILSDPAQPRGAVLLLVNWDAFTQRLPNEAADDSAYLSRLRDCRAALDEYRDRLQADIVTRSTQYGRLLNIWEAWRKRDIDPTSWQARIEETRQRLQAQSTRLSEQIAILRDEIAHLQRLSSRSEA